MTGFSYDLVSSFQLSSNYIRLTITGSTIANNLIPLIERVTRLKRLMKNNKLSTCQAHLVAGLTGSNLPSAKAKHINKLRRHCRALKRPAVF